MTNPNNIIGKGNRFTSENQPATRGRKPKLYNQLKKCYGLSYSEFKGMCLYLMQLQKEELKAFAEDKETPMWIVTICRAILRDATDGETRTVMQIRGDVWAKEIAADRAETVNMNVTSDIAQMTVEEIKAEIARLEQISEGDSSENDA